MFDFRLRAEKMIGARCRVSNRGSASANRHVGPNLVGNSGPGKISFFLTTRRGNL